MNRVNVWKIGSNWGNEGPSVLDLFIGYGCVFFSTYNLKKGGDYLSVKKGDFFIIADGATAVGMAKALGSFRKYEECGISFTRHDKKEYIDDDVLVCKASVVLFSEEERSGWSIQQYMRFCACQETNQITHKSIFEYWAEHQEAKSRGTFNIECGTYLLLSSEEDISRQAILSKNRQYQIPIYQRPYSWNENNLRRLMEDLRDAVKNQEPIFMGTMQLSEPIPLNPSGTKHAYDVIDGQQRITSFIILLGLLGMLPDYAERIRTLVNQGQAQNDLDSLWNALKEWSLSNSNRQKSINPYIQNAQILDALLSELFDGKDGAPSTVELKEFIRKKVLFVVIETHAGLSKTLKIFNTINTTGMDLGAEDLFKIRFYEYLKQCGEPDEVFNRISEVYARVAQGKKEQKLGVPNMEELLSTYQRVLVAKYDLSADAFNMGYERFFDQLFDTLLNIREWPLFKKLQKDSPDFRMSTDDLNHLLDCFDVRGTALSKDWNFRIIDRFLWETRYGGQIWNSGIIALFFNTIKAEQLQAFTLDMFKLLCPPSLYYAKMVYGFNALLISFYKTIAKSHNESLALSLLSDCFTTWRNENMDLKTLLVQSFEHEIVAYPKWKCLICRLIEYIKSDTKDKALYDRLWSSTDIEHIQCFTDEKDSMGVREAWGSEINRLGNLVILESSINRSINNRTKEKPDGYRSSQFESVKELADKVGLENGLSKWKREDAERRREDNSKQLISFIFS